MIGLFRTVRQRINERRLKPFLWFAGTGVVALSVWLGWPGLMREPYVRVQGSSFVLLTTCAPVSMTLRVGTQYASLTQARLTLQDDKHLWAQYPLTGEGLREDRRVTILVTVPPKARSDIENAERIAKVPSDAIRGIAFDFARMPALDLEAVSVEYPENQGNAACQSGTLTGAELATRVRGTQQRLMHYYVLHDALSNSIFLANEVVGNILLGSLILTSLWLTIQLVRSFGGVYLTSDERLNKKLRRETVQASYAETYRRLAFCRVLGPAVGFLLTVSSLVAGLHPAATAAKDTFHFVSSLQLALVATFMGLAVRILAEFALRFDRDLAQRKLQLASRKGDK